MTEDQGPGGRTLIVGAGSSVRTDDGAGLLVVRRLRREGLPHGVEAEELRGGWTDLLERLGSYERIVIVDAMDAGEVPGTVLEIAPAGAGSGDRMRLAGSHLLGLAETLALAEALGLPRSAELRVIGIQVEDAMSISDTCTPAVEAAIALACARVRRIVASPPR